jgi:hypothetical protein
VQADSDLLADTGSIAADALNRIVDMSGEYTSPDGSPEVVSSNASDVLNAWIDRGVVMYRWQSSRGGDVLDDYALSPTLPISRLSISRRSLLKASWLHLASP